jgi:cytochrome c-type biogenesis protein CcsB
MSVYDIFFKSTFGLYLLASAGFFLFFITQNQRIGFTAAITGFLGFLLHTSVLIYRSFSSGYLAVTNLYESISFFVWLVMLVYLIIESRRRSWTNGAFIMPFVVLMMGYALILDNQARPLPVALKSPWLAVHATLCFLSYACFLMGFCLGVMYLWQERELKSRKPDMFFFRLPSLGLMDRLGFRAISFGFVCLSLGIISGSVWAQMAWGSFWSWDPKETWSLIVWFIYLAYLHGRFISGWQGRKSAYVAILGFLTVLFTYFGVSLLFSGLHSYFK